MYNGIKQFGILILVSLLITALFVPSVTSAQAEQPEWEEGDSWAMGAEGDILDIFSPGLEEMGDIEQIINQTVEEEDELEQIGYDFSGEFGFYQIYEVTEVTDDGYVMEIEEGGGIEASASFEVTGKLPEEGEYDMDEDPPKENKTISVEVGIIFMLDKEETVYYDEDLAIEKREIDYSMEFSVDFSAENFPMEEYDRENDTITIEYEDISGGISAEIGLQLEMEFEPALDIFQFPIEEDTSWIAESEMTTSGSYEGIIDVDDEDMPEEFQVMIEQIEDDLGEEFPIILEEIDTEEDEMNFGEIEETTEEMMIPMKCTGTREYVLYDGTVTDTHILEFGPEEDMENNELNYQQSPSTQMLFSEEEGFIVSQQISLGEEIEDMVDVEPIQMHAKDVEESKESKRDMLGEYTLTININGEGTVEVDGEEVEDGWTGTYDENTEVNLEAIPEDEWEFDGWTGDYGSEEESITVTMDSDLQITATFEEIDEEDPQDIDDLLNELEDIPGFTFILLVLGLFIATGIYLKKEKKKEG